MKQIYLTKKINEIVSTILILLGLKKESIGLSTTSTSKPLINFDSRNSFGLYSFKAALVFLFFMSIGANAQINYYSKANATSFTSTSSWGTSLDGTGAAPTSISNASNFIVANGASLTLDADASVRTLAISSGFLTVSANTLTVSLSSGNASNLTISNGGYLTVNTGGTINVNGYFLQSSGGVFTQNGGNINVDGNSGVTGVTMTFGSSSGKTITVASTAGLLVNSVVTVSSGTGVLPANTFVTSILSATQFTVNNTPTTSLAGATLYATNSVTSLNSLVSITGNPSTVFLNGGTFTIVDPHANSTSVYALTGTGAPATNVSTNHTFKFGNGTSTDAGLANGFYVISPTLILGNVVVDNNVNLTNNRQVITTGNIGILGNLTVNSGGEYRVSSISYLAGNLTNNGTVSTTSTLNFGSFYNAVSQPATATQTISGSGFFRNSVTVPTANYTSLTFNNTSLNGVVFSGSNSLLTAGNTGTVSGTLTFTNCPGGVDLGGGTFTQGINTTTPGTTSWTAGGFKNGTFKKWFGTATLPTALPSTTSGNFPFVVNGANRNFQVGSSIATLTSGGTISVTYTPTSGLATVTGTDPSGTFSYDRLSNAYWAVSSGDGLATTGTYLVNGGMEGITNLTAITNEPRLVQSATTAAGTHVAATGTVTAAVGNRSELSLSSTATNFYMGINSANIATAAATVYSVKNGNWNDATTWNTGVVPVSTDTVTITVGTTVTVDNSVSAAACNSLAIVINGTLNVTANTLNTNSTIALTGITMGNFGILNQSGGAVVVGATGTNRNYTLATGAAATSQLNISGGTLTVNGNINIQSTSVFSQSGGTIKVDGNSGVASVSMTAGSGSTTTITVASTSGLVLNSPVSVTAGTGVFAAGTYVTSIVSATQFTVNVAPTTALAAATVFSTSNVVSGTALLNISSANTYLTGGTIIIVDPHANTTSATRATNRAYSYNLTTSNNVGLGHTLQLGDGTSIDAGGSIFGFVLDCGVTTGKQGLGNLVINGGSSAINRLSSLGTQTSVLGNVTVNANSELNQSTYQLNINGNLINDGILTATSTGILSFQNTINNVSTPSSNAQTLSGSGIFRNGAYLSAATAVANTTATITVPSTTGLVAGMLVSVQNGAGAFPAGTTVVGTPTATSFVASAAPTTALPIGSVIVGSNANFNSIIVNNNNPSGVTFSGSTWNSFTNATASGTLTFTNGFLDVSSSSNGLTLGVSGTAAGTLAYTAGGFKSGSTFRRWVATTVIAIPAVAGQFPFLNNNFQARHAYFGSATALATAGWVAVKLNEVAGTTAQSITDLYAVSARSNSNWAVTTGGSLAVATANDAQLRFKGDGIFALSTPANLLAVGASASANGTSVIGTGSVSSPEANKTGLSTVNVAQTYYVGTQNTIQSTVTGGAWSDATTWMGGVVPTCSDVVLISNGATVTVTSETANSAGVTVNFGGTLAVSGGTLNIGCTNNNAPLINNGTLTVSGGAVNVNGNIQISDNSNFTHSAGTITIDGNNGGALGNVNSVASGTPLFAIGTAATAYGTTGGTSVVLSGGSIVIKDPHLGSATATSAYSVYGRLVSGVNVLADTAHIFQFGDGTSTDLGATAGTGFVFDGSVGSGRLNFGSVIVNAGTGATRAVTQTASLNAINGNLTITSGTFTQGTATTLIGGNIDVNGSTSIFLATGTTLFAKSIGSTTAAQTTAQSVSVSASGQINNLSATPTANFTSININNSSSTGVTFGALNNNSGAAGFTGASLTGVITFNGNATTTGSNALLWGTSIARGTGNFNFTSGGMTSGSTFAIGTTTTQTGTTIAASTANGFTTGTGGFPFVDSYGNSRSMWIQRASPTGAGIIGVKYTDVAGVTTGLSYTDGAYTVTDQYNSNWSVNLFGTSPAAATFSIAASATNAFGGAALLANARLMNSNAFVGTYQAGTTLPNAQRTALTLAQLTASPFYMGLAAADVPFVSVTNGNWETASTWNKNAVPTAADNIIISSGTTVTVNSTVSAANSITVNKTGTLSVSGSTLTATTTVTNSGTINVSGGTFTSTTALTNNTASTITVSDAGTLAALTTVANSGTINATGGNFNVTGGSATGITNNAGASFIVAGGSVRQGPVGGGNTLFTNSGILTVSSGVLNVNGSLTHSGTAFNQSGGAINLDPNAAGTTANSTTATNYTLNLTSSSSGALNWTGGTLTLVDPPATASATHYSIYYAMNAHSEITSGHTLQFGDGISSDTGGAGGGFYIYNYVGSYKGNWYNIVVNGAGNGTTANSSIRVVKQTSYANNIYGNLTINYGGEFDMNSVGVGIGNNLYVNNGGVLTASGTLTLANPSGTGVIVNPFNAQSINGGGTIRNLTSSPTANLTGLQVGNSNPAGITLNTPLTISGTLTMSSGLINTTTTNLLTLGTASAAGTLSIAPSASTMIVGPFARTFAASRTAVGTYDTTTLFPVGKGTAYTPVYVDPTTAATGAATISGEAFATNSGTGTSDVTNLSAARWEVLTTSGFANITNSNVRVSQSGISSSQALVQAPTAAGVYDRLIGTSTYAPIPVLTGSGITASSLTANGYFAYGNVATPTAPVITSFSTAYSPFAPIYLCSNGGSVLTITGSSLGSVTSVVFNSSTGMNLSGTITNRTSTSVTVTVPAGVIDGVIRVTNPTGTTDSVATYTTALPPTVGVSSAATICSGTSTSLVATGGNTYTWSPSTALSATTGDTVTASPTATTTYTVTGIDTVGCKATSTVLVTVNPTPTAATAIASKSAVCVGSTFNLTSSGLGMPMTTPTTLVSPTGDGGFESGATFAANNWTVVNDAANTWQVGAASTAFAGSRAGFVSSDSGATWSYAIGSTSTSHFYRDITVPAGSSNINLSFQWKGNGESGWDRLLVYTAPTSLTPVLGVPASNSSTLTGATLVFTQPSFAQSTYTSASVSLPASLVGTTFRLIFTWQNDSSFGTSPGASIDNISLTAQSPETPTYTWTSTPAGFTSNVQNPIGVVATSTSVYNVTLTGSNGCTATASTASVTVNPLPTIVTTGTTNCGTSGSAITATGADTYVWTPALGLNGTSGTSVTASPAATTTYTVTGTYTTTGCVNTATALVTVNNPVTIAASGQPANAVVLVGNTATFSVTASGTGLTYQWQVNNTSGWSDILGATAASYTTPATTMAENNYQYRCVVSGTAPCAPVTSNAGNLTVGSVSIASQPASQTICSNNSATFSITTEGQVLSYQWQYSTNGITWTNLTSADATTASITLSGLTSSNTGTKYQCILNAGEVTSNPAILTVGDAVTISTQPASQTVCSNAASVVFTTAASGTGLTYQWQLSTNGTTWNNVSGATSSTYTINTPGVALNNNQYRVVVSGISACTPVPSDVATLTVNEVVAITTQPTAVNQCSTLTSASFNIVATGTGVTYQWQYSTNGTAWNDYAGATASALVVDAPSNYNGNSFRCVLNGTAPCISLTSSVVKLSIYQILGGTYTVGTGGNFATLPAAITAFNEALCFSDSVVFSLTDSSYDIGTTALTINQNAYFGSYNLTIKPAAGVTSTVTGAVASGALINIRSNNVIIDGSNTTGGTSRDLTITNTSATAPNVVVVGSTGTTPITNVTLKNSTVINGSNGSSAIFASSTAATAGYFNNITIQNNSIQKAYIGIYANATVAAGNGSGLVITGNSLDATGANSIRLMGIYVQGVDGATVSNNTIANIVNANAESPRGIWLATATTNTTVSGNTVSNCSLTNTGAYALTGIYVNTGATTLNISVTNNTVSNLSNSGSALAFAGILTFSPNTSVTNNTVSGLVQKVPYTFWGIVQSGAVNSSLSNNTVTGLSTSSTAYSTFPSGINLQGASTGVTIENNKVSNIKNNYTTYAYGAYGINLASSSATANVLVKNNMVWDIATYPGTPTLSYNALGIYVAAGAGYQIYNNTVNLGTSLGSSGTINSAAFAVASTVSAAGALDVRNNIFTNTQTNSTTGNYAIYSASANTIFSSINYNDYWTSGTNLGYLTSARATLADIVTGFGGNTNSLNVAPNFMSASNMHLSVGTNSSLDNLGTPIATVTTDIDGDARSASTPDMGADEFTTLTCASQTLTAGTVSSAVPGFCDTTTGINVASTGYTIGVGTTYQWEKSTDGIAFTGIGTASANYANLSTGALTATAYYRLATICDGGSTVYSNVITITKYTAAITTVSPAVTICTDGSTTLTAAGSTTYVWTPSTGLNGTTGTSVTATPSLSTTYSVTGTDTNGCPTVASVLVTVNKYPAAVTITQGAATVCTNAVMALTAEGGAVINSIAPVSQYLMTPSSTTYTDITGTTLDASSIGDDVGVGNLPIGFTFPYNGGSQTVFAASSNGLLLLGNTTVALTGFSANALASNANAIAPFWDDNNTTGGSIIYATTGTAPNRVLTVQWTNMHVAGGGSATNPTISVQALLYESGKIEFIYGSQSAALSTPTTSIGLSGAVGNYLSVTPLSPLSSSTTSTTAENASVITANLPSGSKFTFNLPTIPTTLTWSPSTNLYTNEDASTAYSGSNASVVYTKPSDPITYTATAANGVCTTSATTTVTPIAKPAFTLADATICRGQSTTLTATGSGITYSWSPATGLSATTGNSVTASPLVTTTYSVLAIDSVTGCTDTKNVTVTVLSPGAILSAGTTTTQTVVPGQSTTFTVATASGTTYSYQWQVNTGSGWVNLSNAGNYNGVTTATLAVSNIDASFDNNNYQCLVTGPSPCVTLTPVVANLHISNTGFATQPSDVTICNSGSAAFSIATSGDAPFSIQWQMSTDNGLNFADIANGLNATGLTFANTDQLTLNVSGITLANSGLKFACIVNSYIISNPATITVKSPVVITTHPTNQTVCVDSGVATFTATATGSDLAYQWQYSTNGTTWSNYTGTDATTASISIVNPELAANGTQYQVVVSGNAACSSVTSTSATLFINNPTISTAPVATTAFRGNTATFTVVASSATTYQWQRSATLTGTYEDVVDGTPTGNTYTGASLATLSIGTSATTATGGGNFYRCVVNNNGCLVTSTGALLTVVDYCASNATSDADEEITNVTFGTLNNSSTCGFVAPGIGSVAFRYSNYTNGAGAPQAPNLIRSAVVPFSLTQTTCGGNYSNKFAVFIDWNQDGDFADADESAFQQASSVTGSNTQTGTITIPATATLGNTRMRVINVETTGTITACGTYTWGETEDYLINVLPTPPCDGAPTAGTASVASTSMCAGNGTTVTLNGSSSGVLGITYQWYYSANGTTFAPIANATTTSLATGNLTADAYYYCTVTCANSALSANSNTIAITVSNPLVTATTPGARCGTGTVVLGAEANAGSTINWYSALNGGVALGTGASFTTPSIAANTTYYAEAFTGQVISGGKPSTDGADGTNTTGGIYFTANSAFKLNSVVMYPTGAGANTIVLYSGSTTTGTPIYTSTYTFTGANSSGVTVPLNWNITPGSYTIYQSVSGASCYRDYSVSSPATVYPYNIGSAATLTGGSLTGYYYFFYNWMIQSGCASTRTAVVATVEPTPTASISYAGAPFCNNAAVGSVTLTGTGAYTGGTYTSTSGLGLNGTTGAIDPTASTPGSYVVTYTTNATANCTPQTATRTVVISESVLYSGFTYASATYCNNSGTVLPTITGTPGVFTVSPATGLTVNATTGAINFATATPGNYTVTNTVTACSNNSVSTFDITVYPAVVITTQPTLSTVCAGTNASLTVAATGTNVVYQWQMSTNGTSWSNVTDGGAYSGATTATLALTGVSASMSGYQFKVLVSDANPCVGLTSSVATLTVSQTATPVFTPANPLACLGSVTALSVASASVAQNGVIGTGSVVNTLTTPFKGYWGGSKAQYIYTAAELSALGYVNGTVITSLGLDISAFSSPYTFNGFNIAMKNSSSTVSTTTFETGMTTVKAPSNYMLNGTAPFTATLPLDTNFTWDGTSNLVIQFCFDNNNGGGTSTNSADVKSTTTATNLTTYYTADNSGSVCSTATGIVSTTRPNMSFGVISGSLVWSPTTDLYTNAAATTAYTGGFANKVYTKPSANITYTVTATNSLGCTSAANVNVTVLAPATLASVVQPLITCSGYQSTFQLTGLLANSTSTVTYTINGIAQPAITGLVANASGTGSFTVNLPAVNNGKTLLVTSITRTDLSPNCTTAITANNSLVIQVRPTVNYYADADGDGFGNNAVIQVDCQNEPPTGFVLNNGDCNDSDASINATVTYYVDADGDGFGSAAVANLCSATAPAGYSVNNTDCNDTVFSANNICPSIVNLKFNIEGYYNFASHAMVPVKLNQSVGTSTTDVDDVTIELRTANGTLVDTAIAALKTNGTAVASFATGAAGSYYLVIKYKNAIETWSATQQLVGLTPLTYDFTTAASKAYGNNMKQVSPGVYAIYSGDINQDANIDNLDYSTWEEDANNLAFGYFATDLNGDGNVDNLDYSIWETNSNNFIYSITPF